MARIDEWNPVFPQKGEPSQPPDLVGAIYRALMSMKPRAPAAVHFYLGEGLRWIRVGFDGDQPPLKPAAVKEVGKVIEACIPPPGPLFFNALRPHDLLFFLESGDPDSVGLPAEYFGIPLRDVLRAWRVS